MTPVNEPLELFENNDVQVTFSTVFDTAPATPATARLIIKKRASTADDQAVYDETVALTLDDLTGTAEFTITNEAMPPPTTYWHRVDIIDNDSLIQTHRYGSATVIDT